MNKYKEAIDTLVCKASTDFSDCNAYLRRKHEICLECDVVKAYEILNKLVEKATPKKAISHGIRPGREINTVSYTCPVCDEHIGVDNFCKFCGQAIDWSNDDE